MSAPTIADQERRAVERRRNADATICRILDAMHCAEYDRAKMEAHRLGDICDELTQLDNWLADEL